MARLTFCEGDPPNHPTANVMLSTSRAKDRFRSLSLLTALANLDLLLFASSPCCNQFRCQIGRKEPDRWESPVKYGLGKPGGFGRNDALLPDDLLVLLLIRGCVVSSQSAQQRQLSFKGRT